VIAVRAERRLSALGDLEPKHTCNEELMSSAMAKPAKRHVPGGRVTPKGSGSGGRVTPKDGSDRRPGQSTRYTPPVPREVEVSPTWVPVLMFALLGIGLVVIFLNYLELLPGGMSNAYLGVGLLAICGGIVTATQYR
jgi:Cell division protein CrgA